MAKKPETVFTGRVLDDLYEQLGGVWFKIQQVSVCGTPDILGCLNGQFVALELKTEKGIVSELQNYELARIKASGGLSLVVRPSLWQEQLESVSRRAAVVCSKCGQRDVPPGPGIHQKASLSRLKV